MNPNKEIENLRKTHNEVFGPPFHIDSFKIRYMHGSQMMFPMFYIFVEPSDNRTLSYVLENIIDAAPAAKSCSINASNGCITVFADYGNPVVDYWNYYFKLKEMVWA